MCSYVFPPFDFGDASAPSTVTPSLRRTASRALEIAMERSRTNSARSMVPPVEQIEPSTVFPKRTMKPTIALAATINTQTTESPVQRPYENTIELPSRPFVTAKLRPIETDYSSSLVCICIQAKPTLTANQDSTLPECMAPAALLTQEPRSRASFLSVDLVASGQTSPAANCSGSTQYMGKSAAAFMAAVSPTANTSRDCYPATGVSISFSLDGSELTGHSSGGDCKSHACSWLLARMEVNAARMSLEIASLARRSDRVLGRYDQSPKPETGLP